MLKNSYLIFVLIAIIIIGRIVSPQFLSVRNATNVLIFSAIFALLAVGQFFVVLTAGIDLSVGSIVALSTVVAALSMQQGASAGVAITVALVVSALAGLLNGFLIVGMGLTPFIATLATMGALKGISYIIQSTSLIQISNEVFISIFSSGRLFGIRAPVVIFVVVTIVAAFLAKYTAFGRQLYAIGGNTEAARLSGLPVARNLILTYVISGVAAGLAGLLAAAQLMQGSSLIGQGYELDAIAAVVVGDATLFGGRGDPISAVIGTFIITCINNIMNLVGISSEPQLVIKGGVIVVAVYLSTRGSDDWLRRSFGSVVRRRTSADVSGPLSAGPKGERRVGHGVLNEEESPDG